MIFDGVFVVLDWVCVCNWSIANSIFFILLNLLSSAFRHVKKWSWPETWSNRMLRCRHDLFSPNCIFPIGNRWLINLIACHFLVSNILFREEECGGQHIWLKVMLFHWQFLRRNVFASLVWACRLILWSKLLCIYLLLIYMMREAEVMWVFLRIDVSLVAILSSSTLSLALIDRCSYFSLSYWWPNESYYITPSPSL